MNDVRKLLDREELQALQRQSNWQAAWMLLVNWSLIAASFAVVIAWPSVATVALAMLVLAGRQLGLGILMHECAHRSFTALSPSGVMEPPVFGILEPAATRLKGTIEGLKLERFWPHWQDAGG